MKRIVLSLCAICITAYAFAQTETINWYVDGQTYSTSTCETGNDINLPPTPPEKLGYTFIGWGEYIPLEYIETTGTQYIRTDYPLYKDSRFEYDIRLTSNLGIDIGSGNFGFCSSNGKIQIKAKNGKLFAPCNMIRDKEKHTIILDGYNDIAQVDDCAISLDGYLNDYGSSYRMYIATWNASESGQVWNKYAAKHYGLRFYERDVLVRDFVPALNKDWVPCMYEKIQKKFYCNAGTGDIIAGPIIDE